MLLKPCTNYNVAYHPDDVFDIKTKMKSGIATLTEAGLEITGRVGVEVRIAFSDMRFVKMFRHFGLARIIRIDHKQGTLFIAVTRWNLFGFFITVNFLRSGELFNRLRSSTQLAVIKDASQDPLDIEFQQMERDAKETFDKD